MDKYQEIVNANDQPSPDTWDKVAESYNIDVADSERNLAFEIIKILQKYKINKGFKLIELGSGSGHLSYVLAEKGYDVTLLDFSQKAIDKAKMAFKKDGLKGHFIKDDIKSFSDRGDLYDVTWNSGVMEHFGDNELLETLIDIKKVTKKYFLFLVPNHKSLPYLMYRYKFMKEGSWIYGCEYLRKDYDKILKLAGFEMIEQFYLGWEFSGDQLEVISGSKDINTYLKELTESNLVPEEYAYLTAFLASPNNDNNNDREALKINTEFFGKSKQRTDKFDEIAKINGKYDKIIKDLTDKLQINQVEYANYKTTADKQLEEKSDEINILKYKLDNIQNSLTWRYSCKIVNLLYKLKIMYLVNGIRIIKNNGFKFFFTKVYKKLGSIKKNHKP